MIRAVRNGSSGTPSNFPGPLLVSAPVVPTPLLVNPRDRGVEGGKRVGVTLMLVHPGLLSDAPREVVEWSLVLPLVRFHAALPP